MTRPISGHTIVAGVAGSPVRHSLSPIIHNAWLREAGVDGVYVAFTPPLGTFADFVRGLRGGAIRGLNVTAPFKEEALGLADQVTDRARQAGSANVLLFEPDGAVKADNTDGEGLLHAFRAQAPAFDPAAGPVAILGAGGGARGAAAAFLEAGAPRVDFVTRTAARGEALVTVFGSRTRAIAMADADSAWKGASAIVNATPLGLHGGSGPEVPFDRLAARCVVMDMVYRPLRTRLLVEAAAHGLVVVDGLEMLIGQAIPSFAAFFGRRPPSIDVRGTALAAMEEAG